MKTTSQSGSTRIGLGVTQLGKFAQNYNWSVKHAATCARNVTRSFTARPRSRGYSAFLTAEVLSQVLRHEQASMQEYYKPGRTRPVLLKRLAKLQRYLRVARFGHSRPN